MSFTPAAHPCLCTSHRPRALSAIRRLHRRLEDVVQKSAKRRKVVEGIGGSEGHPSSLVANLNPCPSCVLPPSISTLPWSSLPISSHGRPLPLSTMPSPEVKGQGPPPQIWPCRRCRFPATARVRGGAGEATADVGSPLHPGSKEGNCPPPPHVSRSGPRRLGTANRNLGKLHSFQGNDALESRISSLTA